jgi:hypothetical protein
MGFTGVAVVADAKNEFLQARAMFEMAHDGAGEDVESDAEFLLLGPLRGELRFAQDSFSGSIGAGL